MAPVTHEPDDTFQPVGDRDPELGYRVHPTAALFPYMGDAELAELAEDIKANGLRDPVVTFKGVLLDGRNRLRACKLVGVDADFTEWKKLDSAELIHKWIISKNLHRRHLTESQRAMVAGKMARKARGGTGANQHRKADAQISASASTPSQSEAAAQLNVSRGAVQQAAVVLSKGSPDLIAAVESGEVAVSRAADIARSAPNDAPAQAAALAAPRAARPTVAAPLPSPDPEPDNDTNHSDDEPEPPTGWATCPCCGHRFDPYEEE